MLSPLACLPRDYRVFRISFTFLKTQHFAKGRRLRLTPVLTCLIGSANLDPISMMSAAAGPTPPRPFITPSPDARHRGLDEAVLTVGGEGTRNRPPLCVGSTFHAQFAMLITHPKSCEEHADNRKR
jgi:hypothetical protein